MAMACLNEVRHVGHLLRAYRVLNEFTRNFRFFCSIFFLSAFFLKCLFCFSRYFLSRVGCSEVHQSKEESEFESLCVHGFVNGADDFVLLRCFCSLVTEEVAAIQHRQVGADPSAEPDCSRADKHGKPCLLVCLLQRKGPTESQ